jgi:hypothetical protein
MWQRTDVKAHRQSKNRELEEMTLERIREAEQSENPFARVLELVNVADNDRPQDMSRFRSLLIQLKESGLPSLGGKMARTSSLDDT